MLDYPIMGVCEYRAECPQITANPKVTILRGLGGRLLVCRVGAEQQVQPARRRCHHFDHHVRSLDRQDAGAEGEQSPSDIDAKSLTKSVAEHRAVDVTLEDGQMEVGRYSDLRCGLYDRRTGHRKPWGGALDQ
jgi:hypothetical protein